MLILSRYNNQRIVVIAPDKSELWVDAQHNGLTVDDDYDICGINWLSSIEWELSGQTIVVTHLQSHGRARQQHRIGIDAPKDYLILREELLDRERE